VVLCQVQPSFMTLTIGEKSEVSIINDELVWCILLFKCWFTWSCVADLADVNTWINGRIKLDDLTVRKRPGTNRNPISCFLTTYIFVLTVAQQVSALQVHFSPRSIPCHRRPQIHAPYPENIDVKSNDWIIHEDINLYYGFIVYLKHTKRQISGSRAMA
jgi:hypothetical protein